MKKIYPRGILTTMRLHRFYIDKPIEDKIIKIENDELIHQWKNVFRYLVGAQLIIFNGDGYDYLCMITELYNRTAQLEIISRKKALLPEKNIGLAMALIKKDNMEMIVQKATELGVSKIFPIISERSEKKSLNMDRAKKIAIEASEQSGRGDIPEIFEPLGLEEFLGSENLEQFEKKIIFVPKEEKFNITGSAQNDSFLIAIGPEGGFSDRELQLFAKNSFKRYSLGNLILRSETAVITSLSLLLLC